jgi:hypothetical protein
MAYSHEADSVSKQNEERNRLLAVAVLTENSSEPKSCGLANVPMVEAADLRQLDDPPLLGWMDSPGLGCVACQRQMAARPMVVVEAGPEHGTAAPTKALLGTLAVG